jgi:4-hydroxy-2-oxoheptanedioate aldolase
MVDPAQVLASGVAVASPAPMVRIPPNGAEMSEWIVKQVLDAGAMGIVFPHVSTVEQAQNAIAACRCPRP